MTAVHRLRSLLREKKGDEAVSFLMTAMLVLIFAVLVSGMIYITQYYNAELHVPPGGYSIDIQANFDVTKTANLHVR